MLVQDDTEQDILNMIFEPQSTDVYDDRDDLESRVFSIKPPGKGDGSENKEER